MTPIYTRGGDNGFSGLLGEGRVPKSDARLEALGVLDEATAALGVARAHCQAAGTAAIILQAQRDLYQLMAEVAATPENAQKFRKISSEQIARLESQVEAVSAAVPLPEGFIIPGDCPPAAWLDVARTIVRRAERRVVALLENGSLQNRHLVAYLNRLSSLIFMLELLENQAAGKDKPTLARTA